MEITSLKYNSVKKLLLLGSFLVALFFAVNFLFYENETNNKPFSINEQLSKIEGEWNDPTEVILGNKDAVIILKTRGEKIMGKDKNGLFEVEITPFGSNNYQAIVVLQNEESDFSLHFYEEENKLLFFSTLTKSSWYLKKIN